MGVDGDFFDMCEPARREINLRYLPKIGDLAVAGVDASIWVHQLARTVDPLAWLNSQYQAVIDRFVLRLYKLRSRYSVAPYVVFDGAPNPAKRETEDKREKQRAKAASQLNFFKQLTTAGRAVDAAEYIKVAEQCVCRSAAFDAHLQSVLDELGFGYVRVHDHRGLRLRRPRVPSRYSRHRSGSGRACGNKTKIKVK